MKKIEVNDVIWFTYHNGKNYKGLVKEIISSKEEGVIVTILTQDTGYRTVPIEQCSFTKPPFVRRSKI